MSFKAVDWILDHSEAEGVTRLVLLVLAENADQDTGECWPSVATIARRARCSERTVQNALRELEASGELSTTRNAGGTPGWRGDRRPNLYVLSGFLHSRGADPAPGTSHGVQSTTPRGADHDRNGVKTSAPKPSREPSEDPRSADAARMQAAARRLEEENTARAPDLSDRARDLPPDFFDQLRQKAWSPSHE